MSGGALAARDNGGEKGDRGQISHFARGEAAVAAAAVKDSAAAALKNAKNSSAVAVCRPA